jgi:hypothetical protein
LEGRKWTGCSIWIRRAERTVRSTRTDQRRLVRPDSRATSGKWTRRTEDTRTRRGAGVRRRATGPLPPPKPPPTPNRNGAAFLIIFRCCLLWTKCCSGLTAGEGGRWCLYQPPHSLRMSGCEGAWDAHNTNVTSKSLFFKYVQFYLFSSNYYC